MIRVEADSGTVQRHACVERPPDLQWESMSAEGMFRSYISEREDDLMLGEKLGEMTGRVIGTRVLPGDDYRYVKMEVTVQQTGQVCGVNVTDIGTYTVFERVPGQLYAQGQGILETPQGEGAIWNGHAVSKPTGVGMAMSVRFSIAIQAGTTGALARLREVLVIGEHEVDDDGNTKTSLWEWK